MDKISASAQPVVKAFKLGFQAPKRTNILEAELAKAQGVDVIEQPAFKLKRIGQILPICAATVSRPIHVDAEQERTAPKEAGKRRAQPATKKGFKLKGKKPEPLVDPEPQLEELDTQSDRDSA